MQETQCVATESGTELQGAGLSAVYDATLGAQRERRRTRATLLMLACVGVAVTLLWSFAMPNFRGPDEVQHIDIIFEMTENHSFTTSRDYKPHARALVVSDIAYNGDLSSLHALGTDVIPRNKRPAFTDTPDLRSGSNQLNQHPPLGWGTAVVGSEIVGIFSEPSDWAYDKYVLLLRFFNALHMGFVGPLIYVSVRRLKGPHAVALLAGLLPLAIPMATNISGMMSNDGMLLLVGAGFAYCVARVVTGDYKIRNNVGFGLVIAAALLTKAWGLLLLPTTAFVFGSQWWVDRRHRFEILLASFATGVTATVVGGWWWVRNVVVEGAVQPHHAAFRPVPEGFTPMSSWAWMRMASAWLTRRFWGWFGTFVDKVRLPLWLATLATVVALICVVFAFRRSTTAVRIFSIAGLGLFFVNSAEVLRQARALHLEHGGIQGIQGRYMFIALPMLAISSAFGAGYLARRWQRFLPLLGLVAAIVMQTLAFRAVLNKYWGPVGGSLRDQIWALRQWTAVGSLGAGFAVLLIAVCIAWCIWCCLPRREAQPAAV